MRKPEAQTLVLVLVFVLGDGLGRPSTYPTANLGFPVDQMQSNFGVTADGAPGTTVHVDSFNPIP